jgi:hypothetical protein
MDEYIAHITSGVSAAKVMATIEIPASHQGIYLPARKYSSLFFYIKSTLIFLFLLL